MPALTIDPPTIAPETPHAAPTGGHRGSVVALLVAALVGAALAAGLTWLVVATVTLDITPAAVGM